MTLTTKERLILDLTNISLEDYNNLKPNKTMEKQCCICRVNFIPTNSNAETRHCCNQCIKELTQLNN